MKKQFGFTLIELSIVLVIIGLIVGGVLVGQDLIRNAQINQIYGKVGEFDMAVQTFRLKYNCLPGDCDDAHQFFGGTIGCTDGLTGSTGTGCNGNGDRIISRHGEMIRFWQHLQAAGLIGEEIILEANMSTINTAMGTSIEGYLPTGPAESMYVSWCAVESLAGNTCMSSAPTIGSTNHIRIASLSAISNGAQDPGSSAGGSSGILSAVEGQALDSKFDDGAGNTGTIQASRSNFCTNNSGSGTTDTPYRIPHPSQDERRCTMFFRMNY